jgi:uncharacterized protein YwqG
MDLAAQPSIAVEQGLPPDGLLAFFYDAEQSTWGFDPTDAGSFAVVYLPDPSVASVVAEWPADVPEHARTGERAAEAGGRPTGPHGHS